MALQRGPAFYPSNTVVDSPPAGTDALTTNPTGLTSGTMTGASGVSAAATLFQISPTTGSTTLATSSAASVALGNNKGWQLPATSYVGGTPTALRVLPAGSVLAAKMTVLATGLAGNDTVTVTFFKRAASGGLTFIGNGAATAANGTTGTTTTTAPSFTLTSDLTFSTGETLYAELYLSVLGQAVTAGTAVASFGAATDWELNSPNGLVFRYLTGAADTAAAADNLTSNLIRVRSAADTATATDTTSRRFTGSRSAADTAGATDTLGRQLIVHRAVNENIGGAVDYQGQGPNSRTVAGVIYDASGALTIAGATCRLLRDADDFLCATVTTGADGAYSFARDLNDPNTYHVEVYVGAGLHGLTDRGLVPA